MIGVSREVAGIISLESIRFTQSARNTVMARPIFSPLSGGSMNVKDARRLKQNKLVGLDFFPK